MKPIKCVMVIEESAYYTEGSWLESIHLTKKSALSKMKADGFKYCKKENHYYNDKTQDLRVLYCKEVLN